MELQYRGAVWHQKNGRDWTPEAFLSSGDALDLDLAQDAATRAAMLRALPLLAERPLASLRGRRLEAEDFDRLTVADPIHDLLLWLNRPEAFEAERAGNRWATFRDVCAREFDFDPEQDGPDAAAAALTAGGGHWDRVWQRFCATPGAWPGVARALRQAQPEDLLAAPDRRPAVNEEREDRLRDELKAAAALPHDRACDRVVALDEEHGERRGWVWAQIDESPCAQALEPLSRLARAAMRPLAGASPAALAQDYAAEGWRCDRAAIEALACPGPGPVRALLAEVVRTLYEPWLDRSARRLQELLSDDSIAALPTGVDAEAECCLLFVDGLRFDLATMLRERLEDSGLRVGLSHRIAPFPTVTATAKPLASPAHRDCAGAASAEDFCPLLSHSGKPADAARLRDAMARRYQVEVLDAAAMTLATGAKGGAWTEAARIDSKGHKLGVELVAQLPGELEAVAERIHNLLAAGWRKLRVVTDHGWLLLPGGLPRIDLPPWLVETRWARCAAVKGASTPAVPTWPWHWRPLLRIASPPGIGAFRARVEYSHGGLSPQEWVLPDLVVEPGAASVSATVADISWRGMRCRIRVETATPGLEVDLRRKGRQADSSIAAHIRPLNENGEASLVVADDSHEGAAVALVVLDRAGHVLASKTTTVGGEP